MLKILRSAVKVKAPLFMPLMQGNRYYLLDHKKMDDLKSKLYEDRQVTLGLKIKFFLK